MPTNHRIDGPINWHAFNACCRYLPCLSVPLPAASISRHACMNLASRPSLCSACLQGGPFTGCAINPARVLGPAVVFNCYWDSAFIYMLAQFCGGIVAALLSLPLWGPGPELLGDTQEQQALRVEMAQPKAVERQALNVNADSSDGPQWRAQFN
jgi:hypothetical protein